MKALIYTTVALVAGAVGYVVYCYGIAPSLQGDDASLASEQQESQAGVPKILPEFSLMDRDGAMRSINSWPGKSMIVNFWATWCAPCRREIPLLKELQSTHSANFQIVGVAVDVREDVLKYASEIAIDYPILIGEQDGVEAATQFGMGSIGFPFTVFTDNQARIVALHLGELTKPQADILLAVVGRVNSGELTPEAARVVASKQLSELPPIKG
jgi:thiol-disulfide isomerase/thioredoxin